MQHLQSRTQSWRQRLGMGLLLLPLMIQPGSNLDAAEQQSNSGEAVDVGGGVKVLFEVGSGADASVHDDLSQLLPDLQDMTPTGKAAGVAQEIVVRYRGKGRISKRGPVYPQPEADMPVSVAEDPETVSFVALNLANRNEYEVRFPRTLLKRLHEHAVDTGLNRAVQTGRRTAHDVEEQDDAQPSTTSRAWSGNVDNRVRFYGINAPVTHWERQRVSDFGGCTATLIGPRHVITAAHCVYDSSKADPWADNVWISVGRNGTSNRDTVYIDNDNIPSGQVLWYWVPSGYISTGHHQYDISVIVTPKRIGATTGGWMGWWVLSGSTLNTQSVWNVGYPACNAFLQDGTPRIDEPSPCAENHLYGDVSTCSPALFTNADGDGWNRNFRHRCDASGGQSGSPLYLNYNGKGWGVTAVHVQSLCGTTTGSPCNAIDALRPLRATRITPEYSGWISYFRNLYP